MPPAAPSLDTRRHRRRHHLDADAGHCRLCAGFIEGDKPVARDRNCGRDPNARQTENKRRARSGRPPRPPARDRALLRQQRQLERDLRVSQRQLVDIDREVENEQRTGGRALLNQQRKLLRQQV